ncbi:MAG: DsbA family protein [Candidatus Eremiobacteraeota bacterium]|nr:DsbA family protein [Candidatus Eremiobacteraeota bacterium]
MAKLKLIYYMDVLSSWCFAAEEPLARLRERLGGRLDYDWRIAYLFGGGPMGYGRQLSDWYYGRLKTITGITLNGSWREAADDTTWYADLAAQAARELGCTDDRVRLALTRAAMVDGNHLGKRDVAIAVAAQAAGLSAKEIEHAMDDPATTEHMRQTTEEFAKLGVAMQPAFVLRSDIADMAVLSGLVRYETLSSCADEMLDASSKYAEYGGAHPEPAA